MKSSPRIAIVGGGPAGLTLARILYVHGFASAVFEREAHPLERPQGGTLDLHPESGQYALARAGLTEGFVAIARYDDQGTRLLDKHAHVHFEQSDPGAGDRPEVDRTTLRRMLIDALPDGCIRWGAVVRDVSAADAGRWNIALDDSVEGPFDLVIGADGAWSHVRPLVSPYRPQYSGITFVEFGIDDIDRAHPALSRLVGRGKVGIEGDGKNIIAQRNGNAHVRGYAIFRVPRGWAERRFDFASPERVRCGLIEEFAGFADEVLDLFRAANGHFVARMIHALPVGHRWENRRGITLIGDAAHVMSPFGGEGVNAGMLDAAELAAALASGADVATAVSAFETKMFERVEPIAEESADAAATHLSHDGLALTIAEYRSHEAHAQMPA